MMNPSLRRTLLWGGSLIALGLMIWGLVALGTQSTTSGTTAPPLRANDHVEGSRTAPAVLIEYSDFQCPACGAYQPIIDAVLKQVGSRIALVYRHYPLTQLHQSAQLAAQASEAADRQGAFWPYHDLLFQRQASWPQALDVRQTFIDYAQELKLDTKKFAADLDSAEVKARVNTDAQDAQTLKLPGTPSFFLNGKSITNPQNADAFVKLVTDTIGK